MNINIRKAYADALSNRKFSSEELIDKEILDTLPTLDECISFGNDLMEIIDSIRDKIAKDNPEMITINQMVTSSFDFLRDIIHLISQRDFSYDSPALAFAMREMYSNFRDIFYLIKNPKDIERKLDFLCLKNIELIDPSSRKTEKCKRKFRYDYISDKQTKKRIVINRWIDKSDKDLWNEGYNVLKSETPINTEDLKVLTNQLSITGHLNRIDSLFRKSEEVIKAQNITSFMQILYMSYMVLEMTCVDTIGVVLRDRTKLFDRLKKWFDDSSIVINKKGFGTNDKE